MHSMGCHFIYYYATFIDLWTRCSLSSKTMPHLNHEEMNNSADEADLIFPDKHCQNYSRNNLPEECEPWFY